jgi:uncharacterized protein
MDRETIIERLERERNVLSERFDVSSLRLFGSFARNDASAASDIDLVVRFRQVATFRGYMDLLLHLENLLGRSVDLVTEDALRPELRPDIDREAIHVT